MYYLFHDLKKIYFIQLILDNEIKNDENNEYLNIKAKTNE